MLQYVVFEAKRARSRVHHYRQLSSVTPAPQRIAHLFGHPCLTALVALGTPRRRAAKTSYVIGNPERLARAFRKSHEGFRKSQRCGLGVVPAEDAIDARREIRGCCALASRLGKVGGSGVRHGTGYGGNQILADNAASNISEGLKQMGAGYRLHNV